MKTHSLTTDDEIELLRRYTQGDRVPGLLTEFNVSAGTLRNIRLRHNVPARHRLTAHNRLLRDEQEIVIVERYLGGEGQSELARQFGVSQSVVARLVMRHGVRRQHHKASGAQHGSWKGGRIVLAAGYIGVKVPRDDPHWTMANIAGYVPEHRLVMARSIGRLLLPGETVHHINGDHADNRIENLQLRQGPHGRGVTLACMDCGSHRIEAVPLSAD